MHTILFKIQPGKQVQKEILQERIGLDSRSFDMLKFRSICVNAEEEADAAEILAINRGHWAIENSCHYIIDWNYNEDRSRISKGFGPENITV